MIGYFLPASKCDGLNISPCRSVLPSRALTTMGVGGVQPAACSRVMSARAMVATAAPSSARRIDEETPVRRQRHRVVGVFRGQQRRGAPVERHLVERLEIRIARVAIDTAL